MHQLRRFATASPSAEQVTELTDTELYAVAGGVVTLGGVASSRNTNQLAGSNGSNAVSGTNVVAGVGNLA